MIHKLSKEDHELVRQMMRHLCRTGRYALTRQYIQHGTTTVFDHCMVVGCMSLWVADALHIRCRRRSLIRGALLHDYFLYDWHEKSAAHRLHGFTHPSKALRNAAADWKLDRRTADIIRKHMFPLVPLPPAYRESWIVCISDKICALAETLRFDARLYSLIGYSRHYFR